VVGGHGARLPRSQKRRRLSQTHALVAEQQQSRRPLLEASPEEMVELTANRITLVSFLLRQPPLRQQQTRDPGGGWARRLLRAVDDVVANIAETSSVVALWREYWRK